MESSLDNSPLTSEQSSITTNSPDNGDQETLWV